MIFYVFMSTRTHHHPSHQSLTQEQEKDPSDAAIEKSSSVLLLSILAPVIPTDSTEPSKSTTLSPADITQSPIKCKYDGDADSFHTTTISSSITTDITTNTNITTNINGSNKLLFDSSFEEELQRAGLDTDETELVHAYPNDNGVGFSVKQQDSVGSIDQPSNETTPENGNKESPAFSVLSSPTRPIYTLPDDTPPKSLHEILATKTSPLIDFKTDHLHITANSNTFSTYHHKTSPNFLPCQNKYGEINRGILAKDFSHLINSVPIASATQYFKQNISNPVHTSLPLHSLFRSPKASAFGGHGILHICKQKNKSQDHLQQSNDFLSLSLSPPLSRRRNMPALRGPFVSL